MSEEMPEQAQEEVVDIPDSKPTDLFKGATVLHTDDTILLFFEDDDVNSSRNVMEALKTQFKEFNWVGIMGVGSVSVIETGTKSDG